MRHLPLWCGFALGLFTALFTGCPGPAACTSTTCAQGCCDSSGRCQMPSTSACGLGGATCTACLLGASCNAGVCSTGGAGGGSSGGTAGSYPAFLDGFCSAYCARLSECGQLASSGMQTCAAQCRLPGFASLFPPDRSARIGASSFDAARAQQCLTQVNAAVCVNGVLQGDVNTCREVIRPAAAPGAACDSSFDCLDPTTSCNGASCMRRCTAGGGRGESCRVSGEPCDAPFVCLLRSGESSPRCRPEPAPGTACEFSGDCGPNSRCRSGVCERLPAAGQPCASGACQGGLYCASNVCRPVKAAGASCSLSSECEPGLVCSTVCRPRGMPGATCTFSSDCVPTASCFRGACRTRGAQGASCAGFSDCAEGLRCDSVLRTCTSFSARTVATGQSCTDNSQCSAPEERCRGKVQNPDGGVGQPGTCGVTMPGDRCEGNTDCGSAHYCSGNQCVAAGASTPCLNDGNCRATDFCGLGTDTRVCQPRVQSGLPCQSGGCALSSERCLPALADGGMLRCQPVPSLGQGCGTTCLSPYVCQGGMCVGAGRQGQPCLSGGQCLEGGCELAGDTGRCGAPRPNGATCESNVACQSGLCDDGVCVPACPP